MPFDYDGIVDMIRRALEATGWRDGIEVLSGCRTGSPCASPATC